MQMDPPPVTSMPLSTTAKVAFAYITDIANINKETFFIVFPPLSKQQNPTFSASLSEKSRVYVC
jgi:hypothetical protein